MEPLARFIRQDGKNWENLDTYRRNHTMSQNDVVKLGIDLCRALEYCQQSKIVHRHIKPKNIFVDAYGNQKKKSRKTVTPVEELTCGKWHLEFDKTRRR